MSSDFAGRGETTRTEGKPSSNTAHPHNESSNAVKTTPDFFDGGDFFRLIVENLPELVCVADVDGLCRYTGPFIRDALGYEPRDLLGKSVYANVHPDDQAKVRALFEEGVRTGSHFDVEYRVRCSNGSYVRLRSFGRQVFDEAGAVAGTVISSKDISKQSRNQKELEESEKRFRTLSEATFEGIAFVENGVFIDCNEQLAAMIGYERDELIGMDVLKTIAPESRDQVAEALSTHKEDPYEFLSVRKDGSAYPVEVRGRAINIGDRKYRLSVARDISFRKQALENLRSSEERLRFALEATSDGIWDWDLRTDEVYFSKRWYTMLGYEPPDFPPSYERWRDLLHPDDVEAAETAVRQAIAAHGSFSIESRMKAKNGEWVWILSRGKVVAFDKDGRPARLAGSHSDISDRKRVEEALEKRILALTRPLDTPEGIAFEDLFNMSEIQRLQDLYAEAFGVAALITTPDGVPITEPSNFSHLCGEIIRKTPIGKVNCGRSDAMIGRYNPHGPNIRRCLSAGLCNAGAGITVGGRHVANWLIGQVRNEGQNEEDISRYAVEIGTDPEAFRAAYAEVPVMSEKQFEKAAKVLFELANQISTTAYQNVQQARFIADRKQAEEDLKISEERLRLALEASSDGIWDWSSHSPQMYFSPRCYTMLGYEYLEFPPERERWKNLIHPDDVERLSRVFQKAVVTKTSYSVEYRLKAKNGAWKWVLSRGRAIAVDSDGNVTRMTGSQTDITDRKQAEEQIRQLNESLERRVLERTRQLEAATKELEAFSYSVSHDLRAPLRSVDGYTRILEEEYCAELDDEGRRLMGVVRSEAKRMGRLIDELLRFSRLGRSPLRKASTDMTKLARDVVSELCAEAPERTVNVSISDLPSVNADATLLRQLWINLIDNAIKYTRNRTEPRIEIDGVVQENEALYRIKDNGVGFDMKYVGKLFRVFERLHRQEDFPGVGVGLALVQRIVHRHGGRIWVEAEIDKGATFYVTLPLSEEKSDD